MTTTFSLLVTGCHGLGGKVDDTFPGSHRGAVDFSEYEYAIGRVYVEPFIRWARKQRACANPNISRKAHAGFKYTLLSFYSKPVNAFAARKCELFPLKRLLC